jgi:hypothetical protein
MSTSNVSKLPREFRIPVEQDFIRNLKVPHWPDLTLIHAFVRIRDFVNGEIPDTVNPRCHENIKFTSRVPEAIKESIEVRTSYFHLLNRGCVILAKKARYDNKSRTLHFLLESEEEHGLVDGATTDRVLSMLKKEVSNADFSRLGEEEIPEKFQDSYIYVEIIAGNLDNGMRIDLAEARNTSLQVKEFSLEDLGGGFDWLKKIIEKSELRGRIRYKENAPASVDVRSVLALLTLFHPNWGDNQDPLVAYTGKGRVIELYTDEEWRKEYEQLAPVVIDILKLYDYVHINFQQQYMAAYGKGAKLGRRREVNYKEPPGKPRVLPLTQQSTRYVLPDGWLYPLVACFRVLLKRSKGAKCNVKWAMDPFKFFDKYGADLVKDVVEQSEQLGNNPNATGKSRMLWSSLRAKVENRLLRAGHSIGDAED